MKLTIVHAALAATLLGTASGGTAYAQSYPNRPVKIMVPFTPGGGTDILTRIVAGKMTESFGQQVVVENRPGANTLVATEALVRAAPDGYMLLMQTNNFASNVTLYAGKLTFDSLKDTAPVSLVAGNPHVLVVNPGVPAKNLQEYVALAKAKPGSITFASAGSGTVNHLSGELLKQLAGIDLLHVPYKGSGSVMPDLLGGQVNSLFAAMPTVTGHIKEGKLRAIAVTTPKRFRGLPDVPTIVELGYPGYDFSSWFGILAPAGTPKPAIDRLHVEIVKALKDPGVIDRLKDYEIFGSSPEEFAAFIRAEIDKTAKIIRVSGAKIDS
ncbi:MAG: tripartite tricarboxylate transporter substrate binding protein [Burkholderiales bacterium]